MLNVLLILNVGVESTALVGCVSAGTLTVDTMNGATCPWLPESLANGLVRSTALSEDVTVVSCNSKYKIFVREKTNIRKQNSRYFWGCIFMDITTVLEIKSQVSKVPLSLVLQACQSFKGISAEIRQLLQSRFYYLLCDEMRLYIVGYNSMFLLLKIQNIPPKK